MSYSRILAGDLPCHYRRVAYRRANRGVDLPGGGQLVYRTGRGFFIGRRINTTEGC